MRREEMSWEEIKNLSPHLRVIAENAKKQDILKKSGYSGDDELPTRVQTSFSIIIIFSLGLLMRFFYNLF